jgi:hypothetical protein
MVLLTENRGKDGAVSTVLTVLLLAGAVLALGAIEVWLFWKLGEYGDRRQERRMQVRKAPRMDSHAGARARRSRQGRGLPTAA